MEVFSQPKKTALKEIKIMKTKWLGAVYKQIRPSTIMEMKSKSEKIRKPEATTARPAAAGVV